MGEEQTPSEVVHQQFSAQRENVNTQARLSLSFADKKVQREMLGDKLQLESLNTAVKDAEEVPWESLASVTEAPIADESFQPYFNQEIPRQHIVIQGKEGKKRLLVRESLSPPFASGVVLVSFYDQQETIQIDGQSQQYLPLRHTLVVHENKCVDLIKGWRALPGITRHIGLLPPGSKTPASPFAATQDPLGDVFFTEAQTPWGKAAEFLTTTQATTWTGQGTLPENAPPELSTHPLVSSAKAIYEQRRKIPLSRASHRAQHFVLWAGSGIEGDRNGKADPESLKFLKLAAVDPQILEEVSRQSDAIVEQRLEGNIIRAYKGLLRKLNTLGIPLDPQTKMAQARRNMAEELNARHRSVVPETAQTEQPAVTPSADSEESKDSDQNTQDNEAHVDRDSKFEELLSRFEIRTILNNLENREQILNYIKRLRGDTVLTAEQHANLEYALQFAESYIDQMTHKERNMLEEAILPLLHAKEDPLSRAVDGIRTEKTEKTIRQNEIVQPPIEPTPIVEIPLSALVREATYIINEIPLQLQSCIHSDTIIEPSDLIDKEKRILRPANIPLTWAPVGWEAEGKEFDPEEEARWDPEELDRMVGLRPSVHGAYAARALKTIGAILDNIAQTTGLSREEHAAVRKMQIPVNGLRKPDVQLLPWGANQEILSPAPDMRTAKAAVAYVLDTVNRYNRLGNTQFRPFYCRDTTWTNEMPFNEYLLHVKSLMDGNNFNRHMRNLMKRNLKAELGRPEDSTLSIYVPQSGNIFSESENSGEPKISLDLRGVQESEMFSMQLAIDPQKASPARYQPYLHHDYNQKSTFRIDSWSDQPGEEFPIDGEHLENFMKNSGRYPLFENIIAFGHIKELKYLYDRTIVRVTVPGS